MPPTKARPIDARTPGPPWPAILLGCACLLRGAAGCDEGGTAPAITISVTEARMVRCAGTYNGSIVRLAVANDGGGIAHPLSVEVVADPGAGVGDVRADLAVDESVEAPAGAETTLYCSGGLPGALVPVWSPEQVPVRVGLVYRYGSGSTERRVDASAIVQVTYDFSPCPTIPIEPCRLE